ncbi:hypothetical protein BDV97DRAFT_298634, partial [Delphinella strobiligena]
ASLARIRDNQRRSRARRKEYLQELESKNRVCEAIGVEASAEIQAAARRVLDENTRLRQLLKQHGLSDADIDGFSTSSASSPSSNRSDLPDKSHFPAPSATLNSLLQSRKQCTPSSGCAYSVDGNTTSCYIAADAIRSYSGSAGPEVEHALGCHDGSECRVDNSVVFELMDHYDATANNASAESIP